MTMDRTEIKDVAVGPCQKILDEIAARDNNLVPIPVPLDLVLRDLRKRASKKKVDLPRYLTPEPDKPAYEAWLREIENYREFAIARVGGATKVKKRKVKATA